MIYQVVILYQILAELIEYEVQIIKYLYNLLHNKNIKRKIKWKGLK